MKILFVCTGNTCRSPMAEGYLKSKNIKGIEVLSAGICADLSPISPNSNTALLEKGIDMSGHASRQITPEMVDDADKIICMSVSHKQMLLSLGVPDKKLLILGGGIADPYGADLDTYRLCRDDIFNAVDAIFSTTTVQKSDMTELDAKNIADLEKQIFSSPWSEAAIKESFENGTIFLIAEICGEFAGYCGLNTVLDEGYITNIAVKTEHRQKGVASALLKEVERLAQVKKLAFVSLEVRPSNLAAKSLYLKHGYKAVGERKNFYTAPNENALIMTKRFEDENTQH